MHTEVKLTKKQKREIRKTGNTIDRTYLNKIFPLTENQGKMFDSYKKGYHMMVYGSAGTGKTFNSFYLGIDSVLNNEYDRMLIFRSVVPSRDMGFLPGSASEKMAQYEAPYSDICDALFDRPNSYKILKDQQYVEFMSTSFLRGRTFNNTLMLVDECQNMTWQELSTIMTRVGENSKIIICGDLKQSDLDDRTGKQDVLKLIQVCYNMSKFDFIQMTHDDIVRSDFQKSFIIECEKLGL